MQIMKTQLVLRFILTSTALFIIALAPVVFGQGALAPPGAPAPTMKTLTQVEPRTPIPALPYVISMSRVQGRLYWQDHARYEHERKRQEYKSGTQAQRREMQ